MPETNRSAATLPDGILKFTLMHRCTAVAELSLDEDIGFILKIGDVFAPEHLPVGVGVKKRHCRPGCTE
ncbi:hypothetical protein [Ruminococcus sp. HUN007]|uniref:hypothetical protein n=1 Tax=Ruminococcus sp. HUN007 TaxID=1514668 RepID=UPI000A4F49D9|nr:hypothetical protein [Ruminococcus sp. HUN007]